MKYKDENGNWVSIALPSFDGLPIGTIVEFAGGSTPSGWLICNGTAISRTTYAELYTIIGTTYGTGNGSTTFNLPDLRGKVAVGYKSGDSDFGTLGFTGGSKELQAHTHKYNIKTNSGSGDAGQYLLVANNTGSVFNAAGGAINNAGTGDSGNLQPYQVVNYIIKALQITPISAQVVNQRSISTTDTYSSRFINEHFGVWVLYKNSSGTAGNITLSDNISNYEYIEIYSNWNNTHTLPAVKLSREDIKNNTFKISFNEIEDNKIIFEKRYSISGTSITKTGFAYYVINTGESSTWDVLKITKVIGYK